MLAQACSRRLGSYHFGCSVDSIEPGFLDQKVTEEKIKNTTNLTKFGI